MKLTHARVSASTSSSALLSRTFALDSQTAPISTCFQASPSRMDSETPDSATPTGANGVNGQQNEDVQMNEGGTPQPTEQEVCRTVHTVSTGGMPPSDALKLYKEDCIIPLLTLVTHSHRLHPSLPNLLQMARSSPRQRPQHRQRQARMQARHRHCHLRKSQAFKLKPLKRPQRNLTPHPPQCRRSL